MTRFMRHGSEYRYRLMHAIPWTCMCQKEPDAWPSAEFYVNGSQDVLGLHRARQLKSDARNKTQELGQTNSSHLGPDWANKAHLACQRTDVSIFFSFLFFFFRFN